MKVDDLYGRWGLEQLGYVFKPQTSRRVYNRHDAFWYLYNHTYPKTREAFEYSLRNWNKTLLRIEKRGWIGGIMTRKEARRINTELQAIIENKSPD